MTEPPSPLEQAKDESRRTGDLLLKSVQRLSADTRRLESAFEQVIQTLDKRGIQLSVDGSKLIAAVRQDREIVVSQVDRAVDQLGQARELVRTSSLINSTLDLDEVLEDVMDTVISLAGVERAYLMLFDKGSDKFEIRAARNWDRETLSENDVIFSRGVIDTAIRGQQAVLTTNAQNDARFQNMVSVQTNALRSIICIPLLVRGEIVGVLYADNHVSASGLRQDNLELITAFGNQAAIAIENARLYARVKADLDKVRREIQELRIQIDEARLQKEVQEITESDYFQQLEDMARELREDED